MLNPGPTALAVVFGALAVAPLANRLVYAWVADRPWPAAPERCARCGRAFPWPAALPGLGRLRRAWGRPCGHGPEPWRMLTFGAFGAGGGALALTLADPLRLAQALALLAALWVLALVDAQTRTVEPRVVAAGIALQLALLLLFARPQIAGMVAGMLVGAGVFSLVGFFYETLRGRQGLGEGDAAVMALIGLHVGWQGVLPVVAGAALAGIVGGLPWLLLRRRPLGEPLPFVPFLATAGLAVFLAQAYGWAAWARWPGPWGF